MIRRLTLLSVIIRQIRRRLPVGPVASLRTPDNIGIVETFARPNDSGWKRSPRFPEVLNVRHSRGSGNPDLFEAVLPQANADCIPARAALGRNDDPYT